MQLWSRHVCFEIFVLIKETGLDDWMHKEMRLKIGKKIVVNADVLVFCSHWCVRIIRKRVWWHVGQ